MADPFKHPVTGIYYIRRKVPRELREALGREYKRSLGTRDLAAAKGAFALAWATSEQVFALARANATGIATPISVQDAQQIASRWFREEQSRMERDGSFESMLATGPGWEVDLPEGSAVGGPMFVTLQEGADNDDDIDPGEDWGQVVDPHIRKSLRTLSYLHDHVHLDSPVSPMHGFRHTFKTLCREAGIAEEVHDAITGHVGAGGIARDYGSMPLSRMARELEKFPTLHSLMLK